jgi:hypothetical protein
MEIIQNPDGTWRVTGVPLISTGIEYPISTGVTTFTDIHLQDAVAAVQDPAIVAPRIKLGHASGYNDILVDDAEQAFGRIDIDTMHLGDNGQTVYGDYTGMPEWLASVLPMAYPNRSVEGVWDFEAVTGKKYSFVINAVSLLGVRWPGCQVLEDLPLWYGSEQPEGAEVDAIVKAAGGGMGNKIEALVDVDKVRRAFYADVAVGDNYWWWIRGIKYDNASGLQLIVDDEENGDLYRVPVKVKGDNITFGDAIEVTEEYPDKTTAKAAVLAGMRMFDGDMLVYATRAESRPVNNQEGATMDEATRLALASRLGLPEDASEDQINEAITAGAAAVAAAAPEGDPAPPVGDPVGDPVPSPDDPTPEGDPEPEGDPVEAGVVQLDRAAYEQLKTGAALAVKHEQGRRTDEITATVNAAVEAGKIPPARRKHWETALAADFEGNKATLDSLEGGLIPVHMRGNAGNSDDGSGVSAGEGLPESWFPEIAQIKAGAGRNSRVLQGREG